MDILFTVLALSFVAAVLLTVVYALFELSPLAHHQGRYRDPATGGRLHKSPNLEEGHY